MMLFWIILIVAILFLKFSLVKVQTASFSVLEFFGTRWRTVFEGWRFTIPFLENYSDDNTVSLKVNNIKINFTFPTLDNLQLTWEGILEYVADPNITVPSKWPRLLQWLPFGSYPKITDISEKDLENGLSQRAQDEIKKLGGSYNADAFKTRFSRALRYFIETIMRLRMPLHVNPQVLRDWEYSNEVSESDKPSQEDWSNCIKSFNNEIKKSIKIRIAEVKNKKIIDVTQGDIDEYIDNNPSDYPYGVDYDQEIPVQHRLEYYKAFSQIIGQVLRDEGNIEEEHSENEMYYGIDIQNVSNSNIDYTGKMWEAMEAKKRSEKELEGKNEYHERAVKMAQSIMSESNDDIKFGEAYDKALAILGKAGQKNYSFQGMSGNTGMLLEVNNE